MELFHVLPKETLDVEYKEFSYKIDIEKYYSIEEINEIVLGNVKIDERFNQTILDNLRHYSKYYIPKYISAFCNAKLKTNGKFMIGVDDMGEILGIPYLGELPKEVVISYIHKQIHDNIITTNVTMDYIRSNIKINVDKLEINKHLIYCYLDKRIEKISRIYENYKVERDKYLVEYNEWYSRITKYSIKLVDIINVETIFKEFLEYIISNDSSKLFVLKQEIETNIDTINREKTNPDTIYYWVCRFRDERVDKIISERPKKPVCKYKKLSYMNEFIKLGNMRKRLLDTNADLNYYLVTIEIPNQCKDEVFYRDIFNNISKRTRVLKDDEPVLK